MRVLVCGGRYYRDRYAVFSALDQFLLETRPAELTIIQGGATGADDLAVQWCEGVGANCVTVPANWRRHGNRAGPIRNQVMLDEHHPNVVVAFPGGRGTADMVRRAQEAGVKVVSVAIVTRNV